jgi:hypothetical protein
MFRHGLLAGVRKDDDDTHGEATPTALTSRANTLDHALVAAFPSLEDPG